MPNTTMESRRREREDDGDEAERRVQPRSSAPHLPSCVIGLCYRNRKHRFYIPSKENTFCGISYPYVMVDSGCNSFLLPFPQKETENGGFEVDTAALKPFLGDEFKWSISSRGGGRSPIAVEQGRSGQWFCGSDHAWILALWERCSWPLLDPSR